ncbi:MAG TPA: ABC transporter ATP-binding protein [Candidatus Dormibacteraeota bacterium]|jgi:ABC-type lipoprotein export system ATPase subunit
MNVIESENLTKHYRQGDHTVHAVDGVTLAIAKGEFVSLVGRSGSGKTTFLDCIGLLMRPTSGRLTIDGEDTGAMSDGRRAIFRSRKLGFVFQDFNLLDSLTALENVLLPVRYAGLDRKAARGRAMELLEELEVADRAEHRPNQLSGGEKQRLAIARSLINQPSIVLGDEPTGNLDSGTSNRLIAVLRRFNKERGVTFVIVTHDKDLASRTDRVVDLRDGKVIADGPPASKVGLAA